MYDLQLIRKALYYTTHVPSYDGISDHINSISHNRIFTDHFTFTKTAATDQLLHTLTYS
jgi:hypothetical protein